MLRSTFSSPFLPALAFGGADAAARAGAALARLPAAGDAADAASVALRLPFDAEPLAAAAPPGLRGPAAESGLLRPPERTVPLDLAAAGSSTGVGAACLCLDLRPMVCCELGER